jgi:RND family efflux transporter MFP subunit
MSTVRIILVVLAAAHGLILPGPSPAEQVTPVEAITRPSQDVALAFTRNGRVESIQVKQGQTVKEDQLLAELDNSAEKLRVARLKAQAEDTTNILAAQAELDQVKLELKMIREARRTAAATELEVQRAELQVLIAELTLRLRKFQHAQSKLEYQEAAAILERMELRSPLDGMVELVGIEPGEAAEALKPVIRIISIDPLWIDAAVPLTIAKDLAVGDSARVTYHLDNSQARGEVVYLAQDADPASETRIIRVSLPNPDNRFAGQAVQVRFPDRPTSPAKKPSTPTTQP